MENVPTTSFFLKKGEVVGNRTTEEIVEFQKVPEQVYFLLRVCTRPLSELRRITLLQMRVNELSIGSYLFLRTLETTVTGTVHSDFGRNAIVQVEDHFQNRTFCCLYGHVHLRSETELKDLLPVNTVFALKEPLLIACSEQQFAVVVGSPSDFVIVGRSHVLFNDAEVLGWREKSEDQGLQLYLEWSRIAGDLFEKRKFYDAADAYLFALNNCTGIYAKIQLNKNLAKSFLAQGCYESALKHALNVLEVQPLDEIAFYCAGRAHYELRDYTKARFFFQTLNSLNPKDRNYLIQLLRCEERLREAEGKVDILKLYRASLTDITTPIDHGTFCRNIEFRQGPGNVRGVFATEDMDPGTLILVEKALVTIFQPTCSSERGTVNFMRTAFRAILENPKTLGKKLRYLPGGNNLTDKNQRIFCDEVNELEQIVDVRALYQILHRNKLKSKNNMVTNSPVIYVVYDHASRFQHSCLSNCSIFAYKDVVVVRTCASVQKGEELFLRIYGNHLSFREKQEAIKSSGLTCGCPLCALDKKDLTVVHDLRQKLMTKFYEQISLGAGVSFSAEERLLPIVNALELSYRNRDSLHLLLFIVYCDLVKVVDRSSKDWKDKVTLYVERGLQSVGLSTAFLLSCAEQTNPQIPHFVLMPMVLFNFAGIMVEKEYCSNRVDFVLKWLKVILVLERIYRGGNMEMLKQTYLHFKEVPSLLSAFEKISATT